MWTRHIKIKKITDRDVKKQQDHLLFESKIQLKLGDKHLITASLSRGSEEAWVLGYLFSNGYIQSYDEITSIKSHDNVFEVVLKNSERYPLPQAKEISTTFSPPDLYKLTSAIQEKAILFKRTAISESAAVFTGNKLHTFAEDLTQVGAVNKAIGSCVLDSFPDGPIGLFTSGKIDESLVKQALYCNAQIIISRVGVTDIAYDLALEKDLCLIGFARGLRFNLYTSNDLFQLS